MKNMATILNGSIALILVWALVSLGQPNFEAAATQSFQEAPGKTESVASQAACNTGRSIQVSGTAVVNVIPDRVLIQLGIQSNGLTPQQVESANSATIQKIIRALGKLGIAEKDIVTDWYVIQPVYDSYSSLVISGYRIDNVVAVTLRAIGKVNQAIIAALGAGANQVINVEFFLSDLRSYRDQARELAMTAAHEKAQDLAAAAGAEAGCVMSVSENTWSYYHGGWYGQSRDLWTQNAVQNVNPPGGNASLDDDGPVNLGQISVRAEVSASFSLK